MQAKLGNVDRRARYSNAYELVCVYYLDVNPSLFLQQIFCSPNPCLGKKHG